MFRGLALVLLAGCGTADRPALIAAKLPSSKSADFPAADDAEKASSANIKGPPIVPTRDYVPAALKGFHPSPRARPNQPYADPHPRDNRHTNQPTDVYAQTPQQTSQYRPAARSSQSSEYSASTDYSHPSRSSDHQRLQPSSDYPIHQPASDYKQSSSFYQDTGTYRQSQRSGDYGQGQIPTNTEGGISAWSRQIGSGIYNPSQTSYAYGASPLASAASPGGSSGPGRPSSGAWSDWQEKNPVTGYLSSLLTPSYGAGSPAARLPSESFLGNNEQAYRSPWSWNRRRVLSAEEEDPVLKILEDMLLHGDKSFRIV